uniref:Exocyst subunit Exo70 family protein n=1 Tax=Leersia perrieri TaxID=77586 RepID=A0A0D9V974_9ORYZ
MGRPPVEREGSGGHRDRGHIQNARGVPACRRRASHTPIHGWYRARSSGADSTGIWDSDATCTNESLLSAVDEILLLAEIRAFPMASHARRTMEGALVVATSCLVEEFRRVRVWDASQMEVRLGVRFAAVGKLFSVTSAAGGSGGVSMSLAFPTTTGSISTGSTIDEMYASGDGSQSTAADALTVVLDGEFFDELDLICPASLSVLHQIALRVIRAGFTKEFLQAFTNAPCDVMDRFLSMLRLECALETEQISFEDTEWWTTEDMIKRWISTTKLVAKLLAIMQRQLDAQRCGAFDMFKDDYFMAIAKRSIFVLLRFANGFTTTESQDKLVYVLEMYEALSDATPRLLLLFTAQRVGIVSRQVEVVLAKLARAVRVMVGGLVTRIRTADFPQCAARGVGVGVHPLTRYAMNCVELLSPHRAALDLILSNGVAAGADESVNSLGSLVAVLVESLERNLEEMSLAVLTDDDDAAVASWHLFLATNAIFVARRGVESSLLGDEWAARREGLVARHMASYVEACWAAVVACLETAGRKPAKVVAKFGAAFDEAYGSQVRVEVADPALRDALRKAALEMVVTGYRVYLQKHPELVRNVSYTEGEVEQLLSELFEGEAAERCNRP